MDDIVNRKEILPDKPQELARIVIVNSAKCQAAQAALAAALRAKLPAEQMAEVRHAARETMELQLDAEVKLGEYFKGLTKRQGANQNIGDNDVPKVGKEATANELGFDKKSMQRMETLADNKDLVEQIKAEAREADDIPTRTAVFKAKLEREREEKKAIIKKAEHLPLTKFRIVYADPPWAYSNEQSSGKMQRTVLESHYPTMTGDQIAAIPLRNICEGDAVLFLWVTSPMLYYGGWVQKILDAWGFEYKTSMVWDKVKHNVGHYVSVRHEHLLICTRGSCTPDVKKLADSVYSEERTEHSRKPDYFRNLIDELYPYGKRIELFARERHEGWDAWGNQV